MCMGCQGHGEQSSPKDRCKSCNGRKIVQEKKILEVHIDKIMKDGQKIVFHVEVDQEPGLEPGSIIIVVVRRTMLLLLGQIVKHGDIKCELNELPIYGRPHKTGCLIIEFQAAGGPAYQLRRPGLRHSADSEEWNCRELPDLLLQVVRTDRRREDMEVLCKLKGSMGLGPPLGHSHGLREKGNLERGPSVVLRRDLVDVRQRKQEHCNSALAYSRKWEVGNGRAEAMTRQRGGALNREEPKNVSFRARATLSSSQPRSWKSKLRSLNSHPVYMEPTLAGNITTNQGLPDQNSEPKPTGQSVMRLRILDCSLGWNPAP
ncbi:DnaJ subfamily A member 1 [Galemys pyrenaicus]|uniref:DnaJ subfamily A member 1 n=1 Tax=Galemys pyrenaicus TaxID=202257 RepID=A0A8J5ZQ31_GALPY|nr:DnaJ subfamily A member 1 [Galemys pyrenaicus]